MYIYGIGEECQEMLILTGRLDLHVEEFLFGSQQHTAIFDLRHTSQSFYGSIVNSSFTYTIFSMARRTILLMSSS